MNSPFVSIEGTTNPSGCHTVHRPLDAELVPEARQEAHAPGDDRGGERQLRPIYAGPQSPDEFRQKEHEQAREEKPSQGHRRDDAGEACDPSDEQKVEVEGESRLGIDREAIIEGDRPVGRLPSPGGVHHMVVHVGLKADVPRSRRSREESEQRRERGDEHAGDRQKNREAALHSSSNGRAGTAQGTLYCGTGRPIDL